jgi:hypothetical protein
MAPCQGWHGPVHDMITRAAIRSLPPDMRAQLAAHERMLAEWYSIYPDAYRGMDDEKQTAMQPYCETAAGRPIHNVTWRMREDLGALEHSLHGMMEALKSGQTEAAAKHAGVLSHFLADSTCHAHALVPMDSPLTSVYPPPAGKESVPLHRLMEASAPDFTLNGRKPQPAGASVSEAASNLLARCYRAIRENREELDAMAKATYENDRATMDRMRRRSAAAGAALVSDAFYTAFVLAR